MSTLEEFAAARLPHRWRLRAAGWRIEGGALAWQPAPPVAGDPAAARRLASGVFLFDGRLVESLSDPWEIEPPDLAWAERLTGHGVALEKGPYDRSDGRSVYFRDPDGYVLEIFWVDPEFLRGS